MEENIISNSKTYLKNAGLLHARLTMEESLRSGFIFGLWTFNYCTEVLQLDFLQVCLNKIGLELKDISAIEDQFQKNKAVTDILAKERKNLDTWFDIGFWTYCYTRALGHDNFAFDTDTARNLIRTDPTIRKTGSFFIECLIKIGWSPDKVENFNLEKLIPFLYEPDLRKWVGHPNMAVMTDLVYEAQQADKEFKTEPKNNRILLAIKELIATIPIVGKSLSVLIFGSNK